MTPECLHILQHALGCDDFGETKHRLRDEGDGSFGYYRNRFVCDPGKGDGAFCDELVALGLMVDRGVFAITGGMHLYMVTAAGVAAMKRDSPKRPPLSRSAQRYRDFQDEDCGLTFGEWLRNLKHRRERNYA